MVGAVLVRDGEEVGSGFHRRAGGAHAEVEALRQAGDRARGATLYVTLEPCTHRGRTPPCVDAVVAAGVRRVVACHADPNPQVTGHGFGRLSKQGVEVEVGRLAREAIRLNVAYLASTLLGRPAVTLKWAMSLDGRIATAGGQSQWITGPRGRRWALELREEHDAVLVGVGTVLADDPRLDRRLGKAPGRNLRVVLDRRLRTPPGARLFQVEGPVLLYTRSDAAARRRALEAAGAQVVRLPTVDPPAVLADLGEREVRSLLVEGGGEVLGAFVAAATFERLAVATAPLLIGGTGAPGPLAGPGSAKLEEAARLAELRVRRRGEDVIVEGYRAECLQDLYSRLDG